MSELSIDLVTPDGIVIEGTKIPRDYTGRQVVGELVESLGLPLWSPEKGAVTYSLFWVNQNMPLDTDSSLGDLGVNAGDQLKLVPSAPVDPGSIRGGGIAEEPSGEGHLDVWLHILDKGERIEERVETGVPIKDVLGMLVKKHQLPIHDNFTKDRIHYDLHSKFLGKLRGDQTLKQAGVPRLDTLSIVRDVVAG